MHIRQILPGTKRKNTLSLHGFYISCNFMHTIFAIYSNREKLLIHVYGVPTCDKIKKTKSLLDNNKIDYMFINVRKEPLTREKLAKAVDKLGLDIVLNRKGMLYRKLGLKDKNLSNEQLFIELYNEQGMIKRPLIEKNGSFHCGYNEQSILSFVK